MIVYLIGIVLLMAIVATFIFSKLRVVAQPNEWMIVLREGKMVKCGVGISCLQMPNDKIVTFPSKINKVKFIAQQVTKEMQGLEVSGIIIWTIFRDGDGPLKAYKSLGADIHSDEPKIANQNLVEMANGIVRHKIANSNISEVLTNRRVIREDIKKELNKNINGWGVWLETVEITEVKILSAGLFENLQTEFREANRQKAQIITMNAENVMKEKKLEQNLQLAKQEAENENRKKVIASNEAFKVSLESQRINELKTELKKTKLNRKQEITKLQAEAQEKINRVVEDNKHLINLKVMENNAVLDQKKNEVALFEKEKELLLATLVNETNATVNDNNRANVEKSQKMEKEIQDSIPFDVLALEKIEQIVLKMPLEHVRVFNFSEQVKDSKVASALQQLLGEYHAVKTEIEQN